VEGGNLHLPDHESTDVLRRAVPPVPPEPRSAGPCRRTISLCAPTISGHAWGPFGCLPVMNQSRILTATETPEGVASR